MKRRFGWILLLAAVLCLAAAAAETEGDFNYEILENGTAIITYWNGDESNPQITVPGTIGGVTVTAIDKDVFNISKFKVEVTLPDTITFLGDRALGKGSTKVQVVRCGLNSTTAKTMAASDNQYFYPTERPEIQLCWESETTLGLQYVAVDMVTLEIPEGVTAIKARAFADMESLATLVLPDSVTRIENNAFYGCHNLSLTLPDHIQTLEDQWYGTTVKNLNLICTPGSETARLLDAAGIAYTAPVKTGVTIRWVGSVLTLTDVEPDQTEIVVPEGVAAIKAEAFRWAEALRHVTLPSTLETVEPGVRDTLDGFDSIRIPDGADVEEQAFEGVGTNRVVIPEGVTTLDSAAFAACPNLLLVELPSSLHDLPDDLLSGSPFARVRAPAGSEAYAWAEAKGILAD